MPHNLITELGELTPRDQAILSYLKERVEGMKKDTPVELRLTRDKMNGGFNQALSQVLSLLEEIK